MQELAIKDLTENFFEAIGKEWMLVTSGSKEKFNTMTASWYRFSLEQSSCFYLYPARALHLRIYRKERHADTFFPG